MSLDYKVNEPLQNNTTQYVTIVSYLKLSLILR